MTPSLLTHSSAIISSDGRFRYQLIRRWKSVGDNACFIMLNPSTADGSEDDPTIKACMQFAQRWGMSGLIVVNLFAYRSTSPKPLRNETNFIGSMNDYHMEEATCFAKKIVCAWGIHPHIIRRSRQVGQKLYDWGVTDRCFCLGTTLAGYPRHPLYVSRFTKLQPFLPPTQQLRLRLIKRS